MKYYNLSFHLVSGEPVTEIALAETACKLLTSYLACNFAGTLNKVFPKAPELGQEIFKLGGATEWNDEKPDQVLASTAITIPNSMSLTMLAELSDKPLL